MINQRLYVIDVLRFVAAMMVVLFHFTINAKLHNQTDLTNSDFLNQVFLHGFLGVQLFFIISGFVILMSAQTAAPLQFVKARFIRLYPAFLPICIFTFLIGVAFAPFYTATLKDLFVNATLIGLFANWRLQIQLISGVYWTLIVEMQFYVFIFILILLKRITAIRIFLLIWLALSVITYFGELYSAYPGAFKMLRLLFITEHSFFFIAGCYFYLIKYSRQRFDVLMPLLCLALKLVCFNPGAEPLTYAKAVIMTVFFLMFYVIALKTIDFHRNPGVYKMMGALTYPLYLVHELLAIILVGALLPYVNKHVLFVALVLVVLAIAFLFNRYIEAPGMAKLKKILRP